MLLLLAGSSLWATTHTITNNGFDFVPMVLNVTVGDTVVFDIGGSHNAVEVSEDTYNAQGTMSNGGFEVGFGGGTIVIDEAKTYYYVCQPHASLAMIGIIVASEPQPAGDLFVADLSGSNEALPVLSGASGAVSANLDGNTLTVMGSFSGLTGDFDANIGGGAHLHVGYAGRNGGVEIPLNATLDNDLRGGTFEVLNNTFELTEDQIGLLRNRQLYVNIHTTTYPGGELRGQLHPVADLTYALNLFGSNEVPSVISGGSGALLLEVTGDSLFVTGAYNNLEGDLNTEIAGGAHLHVGLAGQNGGIEFPLTVEQDPDSRGGIVNNAFEITEMQKMMLANRMIYANFHSTLVPSGELRGQVRGAADAVFRAHLSGSNEVPPVTTAATGEVLLELDGNTLTVTGAFQGMAGDLNTDIGGGAHIHLGFAGQNGGVIFPLTATQDDDLTAGRFLPADNQFTLEADQIAALLAREYYVNIHSTVFPMGELRGQVVPESQYFFTGFLTGMQEPDPVASNGAGAVIAEISGSRLTLSGTFNDLDSDLNTDIAGGSHLHLAPAGSNGPVQFLLTPQLSADQRSGVYQAADNVFELTEGLIDTLRAREIYVNIHSLDAPSGELRGQLMHESTAFFYAPFSGTSEAPPVNSPAFGSLIAEWNAGRVYATGSFADLQSDFNTDIAGGAHLHFGLAGQNGGIIVPLTTEIGADNRSGIFRVADNTLPVSPEFPDTIVNRQVYVNIHTVDIPSGELRGQVLPYANNYYTATLDGTNEVQPISSTGQGAFKLELNGDQLSLSGSFSDLTAEFDPAVAGGSHLHEAPTGANGAIIFELVPELGDDNLSGVYQVRDNTFSLDEAQMTALKEGRLYFNIHTTDFPGGELRGQVLPETNQYPDATEITGPADGAALTIEGDPETPFEATWDTAEDPDGNTLSYIWQLAADPDFTAPLVVSNQADATNFLTDFATVASILEGAGLEVGQSITVYHRVLSSDGSLFTAGPAATVDLTLGTVTGIDEQVAERFSVSTFPNPATELLQVDIRSEENAEATLNLTNGLGQIMALRQIDLTAGDNRQQLNVNELSAGLYFLQLRIGDRLAAVRRVMIK